MLSTKLTKTLLHTTDNYIKALEKAGVETIGDLLNHIPRDYEDRTNVLDSFSYINIKEKNTILVKLVSLDNQKTANNKLLSKAILEDKNGFLSEAVWFNRKYLSTQLNSYIGKKVIVSGKVKYAYGKVTFQSPEVETDLTKIEGEIVPIYPDLNYIPSKWISKKIELLKDYIVEIEEILPDEIIKKYNFISRKEAFYKVHFPKNKDDIEVGKYRLAYEELFLINYDAIGKKHESFKQSKDKSIQIKLNPDLVKEVLSKLPFELTDHQKITLFQVLKDMEKPHAMARLLEGDVGTGKTVVSLIAVIHAIKEYTPPSIPPLSGEGSRRSNVIQNYIESPEYIKNIVVNLRKKQTRAEDILWQILRRKSFKGLKFRRQHPFGRYVADFYCSELKLIIELDGEIHKKTKEYDGIRDDIIGKYGVNILRIKNKEIYENIEKILDKIIYNKNNSIPSPERGGLGRGIQVAIMAPTEILARQHFESMQNLLFEFGISSELLVGSTTAKHKNEIKQKLKTGNLDVVIGTHALVQEDVLFNNLGFVVIDEQHRFGVKQREVLEKYINPGSSNYTIPHVLNMTATPIPRTLALTLYGDQDLSVISQYPKGRKEIFTKVAKTDEERRQIELFIRSELEKGRQIFWISPLVEESEKIDLANAMNTYESLVDIFSPFSVGLLHGKMKPKEKEQIMRDFSENKIHILSSTSVVEVGVDVPNATIMCIEGSERFGLSQLHQFRGRVGRGQFKSHCYLFPSSGQYTDRLRAMERTNNGFELAEIDLELRGPGEVYGVRQSGLPDLKVASLTDLELISQIREDIEELFKE